MRYSKWWMAVLLVGLVAALAGCGAGKQSGAAQAIESYLKAVVGKDTDAVSTLSCADWAEQGQMEMDSFGAVAAKLDGVSCQEAGTQDGATLVTCAGKIVATYNNENQDIPLDGLTYRAVQQGGDWQMCGYAR